MAPPPDHDLAAALRAAIVEVPDFPRPGVGFKDITPVLADAALFRRTIEGLAAPWRSRGVTHVLAIESRGFLFGAPVALALEAALVPVRKPGKLPRSIVSEQYSLEYGVDTLQLHRDALPPGARALVVDDVLATGGTCRAALRLVERLDATAIGASAVIDLGFLPWREALAGREVRTLVSY